MNSRFIKLISKFASVGLVSTAIHAFVYCVCLNLVDINAQLANLAGYLLAACFSYYFQMNWTFSDRQNDASFKSFSKFASSSLIALALNASFVFIVDKILVIDPIYALLGIVFVTPAVTFGLLSKWVFPNPTPPQIYSGL